jgi:DNA-binding NarL/FixJ family response regulator
MTIEKTCVLVVDDEQLIALALTIALNDMGFTVCGTAATAAKAVELARTHQPSLVLMDVRLKGQADGVDAAREIHDTHPTPVIFITGSRDPETVKRIHEDHPSGILFKPVLPSQLKAEINRVLGL